ncbi:MAG: DEAD/DEAH box helicase [Actinobacteria bacterium]|nr:DEAD/DEAH box helicase [Thermoleophilia bacterium]MCB9010528.1 DEAD/DEAH box helicase [Actinomycetota bacterium]
MTQPTTFEEAGVGADLSATLAARDIIAPFPVQQMVIPLALEGRDVQVKAPTGSGKTLAFGLPAIEALSDPDPDEGLLALVLAPTRELAAQIHDELQPLAERRGVRVASVVGGMNIERQSRRAAKAHLIVATPGRLTDLQGRGIVDLANVEILVLDEADRMLDMGFLPQVSKIVKMLPSDRQTMLFSATLGASVAELAREVTHDCAVLQVEGDSAEGATIGERLDQRFVACNSSTRSDVLMEVIGGEPSMTIVFCRTKRGAARLADRLEEAGVEAGALHGDLTQSQRNRALKRFAEGRTIVLVATDVASRGIDLDGIEMVINYDPPEDQETYTHRIGRTARAGRTGQAVTLVSPDQSVEVGRIALRLGLESEWERTGYGPPSPQVVYRSRGNRSVFAPPRQRPSADVTTAPPRANRVKRGTRTPV